MRTVTVTGQGEARVAPDSAVVRVSAVHGRPAWPRPSPAPTARPTQIATTAAAVHDPGAGRLDVAADLDRPRRRPGRPAGFQARHSLVIRCPDIEAAGGLLTALADAVGDRLEVEGVSLEVADQSGAVVAAREAAYADAVDRATHLAALAGAELGDVQDVVEGGASAARRSPGSRRR